MNPLRDGLPPLPARMKRLLVDERGYPVPYFVAWIENGELVRPGQVTPDFRVAAGYAKPNCLTYQLCWLCGEKLGSYKTFVIGPMCALNRTTSEPPCHLECADFAGRACPFLARPQQRRREKDMPEGWVPPPGEMITRNPRVALIWTTRSFKTFRPHAGLEGELIEIGPPEHVRWYKEGRPATRAEALDSID